MLWYLGFVADEDMQKSNFTPSLKLRYHAQNSTYALCNEDWPLVLFTNITDKFSQKAVLYCAYGFKSVSYMRFRKKRKLTNIVLSGAFFWFPCSTFGNDINKPAILICRVPFKNSWRKNTWSKDVAASLTEKRSMAHLFSRERNYVDLRTSNVRPYLPTVQCPDKEQYHEVKKKEKVVIRADEIPL